MHGIKIDNNKGTDKGNNSNQSIPTTSSKLVDNLPLSVVDRSDNHQTGGSWIIRGLILIPIIMISIAVGGVVGLYKQPLPLQKVMLFLELEPGSGTDNPITIPVNQRQREDRTISTSPTQEKSKEIITSPKEQQNVSAVMALGRLSPKSEVITVAVPSGVREARISTLKVTEGSRVKKGQILAILDSKPRLQAIRDSAKTIIAVREATLIKTRASIRASLVESKAIVEKSKASANRARLEFQRSKKLFNQKVIARANYDQTRATYVEAQKELERMQATLSRFTSKKPDEQPDIIVAQRNLLVAKADYKRTEHELEQAYVRAPIDGTVLEIHTRVGEKPAANGVLDLGNVDQMTAKIEVYETLVRHLSLGKKVIVSTKALPEKLIGEISRIGLQVKKQSVIDSDPAANTDARVVEVIVLLDKASSKIASHFTNLQIEAKINIGKDQ